jgi:hypothetical protein
MGNAANTARAKQRLIDLEPVIRSIRDEGMTSLSRHRTTDVAFRLLAGPNGRPSKFPVLARMSPGDVIESQHSSERPRAAS